MTGTAENDARPSITKMTSDERRAFLTVEVPRHDLAEILRRHIFHASRPWPDGSQPTAPNWNPGCTCGVGLYFFEHDLHLADVLIAAGYARGIPPGLGDTE